MHCLLRKVHPAPTVRRRRTYVTLERVIKYGKTPGCRGCERVAEGVPHTDECHERFRDLLEKDRAIPPTPMSVPPTPAPAPSTSAFDTRRSSSRSSGCLPELRSCTRRNVSCQGGRG